MGTVTGSANLMELADLRRARDLIDRAYAEPLDVAAVARVAHCSPSHFARRYRTVFGETPYQHLVNRRIERATVLLRSTTMTATDRALSRHLRLITCGTSITGQHTHHPAKLRKSKKACNEGAWYDLHYGRSLCH